MIKATVITQGYLKVERELFCSRGRDEHVYAFRGKTSEKEMEKYRSKRDQVWSKVQIWSRH
jgi:hypothetical protein